MANQKLENPLKKLNDLKRSFGISDSKLRQALITLWRSKFSSADSLIQFHEALLFLRAYPPSIHVLKLADKILNSFGEKVSELVDRNTDLAGFDDPEVSGIVGGSVTSNFSYPIVCWLAAKHPTRISIDWDWFEEGDRFGATMPRFLPLLEDDAMVEAHVPYREWLEAAKGRANEIVWLIQRFESLQRSNKRKAELYDALKLHITWRFGFRSSRTGMRRPIRGPFVHNTRLIRRRDISLPAELSSPPIPVQRLSLDEGRKILDLARETSAVRYRELHGFTYGDTRRVLKADLGRGTQVFVMGVPPQHRLPLRAYHAALIFKNGIPVAYFEGLSICERMESGFNLYYTFRDGETAWLYARILRLMRQLLGVSVISIEPYQIGLENEEGIESGAFWFYRKLGFRSVKPELMKLTEWEEKKMAEDPSYRTSLRTLRKLAVGHMIFELPGHAQHGWDNFQVRNLGLALQRRMAREFGGNPKRIREQSLTEATRVLQFQTGDLSSDAQQWALQNLSLLFTMMPGFNNWTDSEKSLARRIIMAKANADEGQYLSLMQRHGPLRDALIQLGS